MRCLDYRSVVGRRPEVDSEAGSYVLQLGSTALEPISYETLLTLQDCPTGIRQALESCFLDKSVMWEDPAAMSAAAYRDQLHEIEGMLTSIDRTLEQAGRPCCSVLARIVGLWRGLTREVLQGLDGQVGSERRGLTKAGLANYRRRAFAFVEALRQLLPGDERCSIETRNRLQTARAELASIPSAGPEHLGEASWRMAATARSTEDVGFVTWGIP